MRYSLDNALVDEDYEVPQAGPSRQTPRKAVQDSSSGTPMSDLGRRIRESTAEADFDRSPPPSPSRQPQSSQPMKREWSAGSSQDALDMLGELSEDDDAALSDISSFSSSDEDDDTPTIPGALPRSRSVPARKPSVGLATLANNARSSFSPTPMRSIQQSRSLYAIPDSRESKEDVTEKPDDAYDYARSREAERKAALYGKTMVDKRRAAFRRAVSEEPEELARDNRRSLNLEKESEDVRKLLAALNVSKERQKGAFARKIDSLWKSIDEVVKAKQRQADEARRKAEAAKKAEEEARRAEEAKRDAARKKVEDEKRAREEAAQREAENAKRAAEEKERAAAEARSQEEKRREDLRKEEEAKRAAAQTAKASQAPQVASMASSSTPSAAMSSSVQDHGSADYHKWQLEQRWIKENVHRPVKSNPQLKGSLFRIAARMRRFVGQVTNQKSVIVRVTEDIHKILCDQLPSAPSVAQPAVYKGDVPVQYAYMISRLAKSLIEQAEAEISVKSEAAFPVAWVVIGLLLRGHGALGPILFSRLVKRCPWVVPHLPRTDSNDPNTVNKNAGFDKGETTAAFVERMNGIASFYFAILQSSFSAIVPTLPAPPTPEQLKIVIIPELRSPRAWTWMHAILQPRMVTHAPVATLVGSWFTICGSDIGRVYGAGQLRKLMEVVREHVGELGGESTASRERTGMLIGDYLGQGYVPPHGGKNWEV